MLCRGFSNRELVVQGPCVTSSSLGRGAGALLMPAGLPLVDKVIYRRQLSWYIQRMEILCVQERASHIVNKGNKYIAAVAKLE
jgi:hypothetical protein